MFWKCTYTWQGQLLTDRSAKRLWAPLRLFDCFLCFLFFSFLFFYLLLLHFTEKVVLPDWQWIWKYFLGLFCYLVFVTHFSLFVIRYSFLFSNHPLFIIRYSFFSFYYFLFVIPYSLFAIHYSLVAIRYSPWLCTP